MEKQKSTKKELKLTKRNTSFKIIIPAKVEAQIRYLCSKVHEIEWSGVLFYKPEGNFEDESLAIRCVDILPMDIGSAAYTEFSMSPDVATHMVDNPELLSCQQGLIHSHNNMDTFFSGTDIATLKEEGEERNHFVSLIVNNAGKYTAAITRKILSNGVSFKSFGDKLITYDSKQEELEYFNLDIVFEQFNGVDTKFIDDRLALIKKEKEKEEKAIAKIPLPTYGWDAPYGKHSADVPVYKKEPKLFDDAPYITASSMKKPVKQEDNPYTHNKYIKDCIVQMLSGNILDDSTTVADIKELSIFNEEMFDDRFGDSKECFKVFKDWATSFIEFLVWNGKNETGDEIVDSEEAAIIAMEICDEIVSLQLDEDSKYIQEYVNILKTFYKRAGIE